MKVKTPEETIRLQHLLIAALKDHIRISDAYCAAIYEGVYLAMRLADAERWGDLKEHLPSIVAAPKPQSLEEAGID